MFEEPHAPRDDHDWEHAHHLAEARILRRDAEVDKRARREEHRKEVVDARPRTINVDAPHGPARQT